MNRRSSRTSIARLALPALCAAILSGCDDETTPTAAVQPAPAFSTLSTLPTSPELASAVLPINDPFEASYQINVGHYPVRTVVERRIEGTIDIYWYDGRPYLGRGRFTVAGASQQSGTSTTCRAYTHLLTFSRGGIGWFTPNPCDSYQTVFQDTGLVYGTMTARRVGGPTITDGACGTIGKPPCFHYAGSSTVTLRRIDAKLTLVGDTSGVRAGTTFTAREGQQVTFKAGIDPAFVKTWLPFDVLEWKWTPDVAPAAGAPTTTACTDGAEQCVATVYASGTMTASGYANGLIQSASVRVNVGSQKVQIRAVNGSLTVLPAERGDGQVTLELAVVDASGVPLPDREITVTLEPDMAIGGHDAGHTAPTALGALDGGNVVRTGSTGIATVVYRAPAVSGGVTLHATSPGAAEAKETITVSIPGLQQLPASGNGWTLRPEGLHAGRDGYLTRSGAALAQQIFGDYFARSIAAGGSYPLDGNALAVTAASLPLGGLFDVNGDWQSPVPMHRSGGDVDFDNDAAERFSQLMARHCDRYRYGTTRVRCDLYNGGHFHAYVGEQR